MCLKPFQVLFIVKDVGFRSRQRHSSIIGWTALFVCVCREVQDHLLVGMYVWMVWFAISAALYQMVHGIL